MEPAAVTSTSVWLYVAAVVGGLFTIVVVILAVKGRRLPGEHVFKASRLSKGNRLLPAQVAISRDSITLYQPQWIGRIEESINIAHVSSVRIDTNLFFSDVFIETTGGHNPIACHGHTRSDAMKMKRIIEEYQSARYSADAR